MATETAPHGEPKNIETPHGEQNPKPAPTPAPPAPPSEVKETDWKAEARKWETRAKENAASAKSNEEAAQRLAEIEESQKTEAQKQADALAASQARVSELEAANLRAEVAAAKGVPAALISGATREALEASADALIEFKGTTPEPAPQKQTYVIPDEGGVPAIGKEPELAPGMGTLRAAYAQPNGRK